MGFLKSKDKNIMSMGLGLNPSKKDIRDYKYSDLLGGRPIKDLPQNYESDMPYFVYNQGESSMCCACALNSIRYMQEHKNSQSELTKALSPCFTYGNRNQGHEYEGMQLREACKKARDGQVLFSVLPHFTNVEMAIQLVNERKDELMEKAHPFRITSFYTCDTVDEIKSAIMETQAVLIGIPIYKCFYYPNENGEIKYCPIFKGKNYGGHAQAIVGWKTDKYGKLWWKSLNSWGEEWGKDGYCWLPENYPWMDSAYVLVDEVTEMKFKQYVNKFGEE